MGENEKSKREIQLEKYKIPENAKLILLANPEIKLSFFERNKKSKYKRDQILLVDGFDFLEYSLVVRPFIQKKYGIEVRLLEMLLYLYPRQVFTHADYKEMPKPFSYSRLYSLRKTGLVVIFSEGKRSGGNLYCLSKQAKQIVTDYYKHLSGERKITENAEHNPLALTKKGKHNDKRMGLIEKMNSMEPSALKKSLYQQ